MDFLDKLDFLMKKNELNKHSLSAACNIPYTTIDNWYKRGYDGLKLSTLKKLALYFGTTLDYWANDEDDFDKVSEILDRFSTEGTILAAKVAKNPELKQLITNYESANETGKLRILENAADMARLYPKEQFES